MAGACTGWCGLGSMLEHGNDKPSRSATAGAASMKSRAHLVACVRAALARAHTLGEEEERDRQALCQQSTNGEARNGPLHALASARPPARACLRQGCGAAQLQDSSPCHPATHLTCPELHDGQFGKQPVHAADLIPPASGTSPDFSSDLKSGTGRLLHPSCVPQMFPNATVMQCAPPQLGTPGIAEAHSTTQVQQTHRAQVPAAA